MSVRQRRYHDRVTGTVQKAWMVDVDFEHPDGRAQRIRKVSPVQTRRGAEQYERDLRDALLGGKYGRKEDPTLAGFTEQFLAVHAEPNNRPSEVHTKRVQLRNHILPALGHKKLSEIRKHDVETYKARKLHEGQAPKSVNNQLAILRKMLNVAVDWEIIDQAARIRPLKSPLPDHDFLTFEEAERLVETTDPDWRTMVITALHTGLRQGELLALRWEDVDLVAGRIVVRRSDWKGRIGPPKGGKPREVPLNAIARKTLREHRHLRGDLVFCRENGERLTYQQLFRALERSCKQAGLRPVQWHALRHTFASHLVMRGVPLKAVQELLGHTTIQMTMRYAHLSPDVRRDAVEALVPTAARHSGGTSDSAQKKVTH